MFEKTPGWGDSTAAETDRYLPVDSFYRGKNVLVTGGFGFVGSHLVAALVDTGAQVTVIDRDCSPGRPSLLNHLGLAASASVSPVEADVVDEAALAQVLRRQSFDSVFHLAACSVIERSALAPRASVRTNVMGVVTLLEAFTRHCDQNPSSIVMLSTDKVYGESGPAPTPETAALTGRGVYEAGKVAGDVLARTFHEVYGLPTTVIRPCNLFGPHDYSADCRVVPRALSALYGHPEPRPPELYHGSIRHRRDFLYIEDAVRMILGVGAEPRCVGEAFNLTGCARSTPSPGS